MSTPAAPIPAGAPGNLPLELTSFVGRHQELTTLERLAAESRLVTVTGAGGIGKTRLAVEYARRAIGRYPHGAWFVDLAPLVSADLVADAVSAALGLIAPPGLGAVDGLLDALADREMLLVLDNCEHLVEPCAQLVVALLTACGRLHVLATSREVLGVNGETTWRLPSMATPTVTRPMTVDELRRLESVELFVRRAEAARAGFRLAAESADIVMRICQQLDGIPLAIELAAARTRTLPLAIIDERLHQRFALLTSQSRGALPRQRTMQATLDWSHDLLEKQERRLFRRLAVFRGGFTLEAAEQVGGDVDVIAGLVDKSLVVLEDRDAGSSRYRLLEPVREYALDRLTEAGDLDATAALHARYYFRWGASLHKGLLGRDQARCISRIEDDLDNFRACFEWGVAHDMESALRLTLDLERYWFFARRGEVHDWLDRSLAGASAPSELRAHALCRQSTRRSLQGAFAEARDLANACLDCARTMGSPLYEGKALMALAIAAGEEHGAGAAEVMWPLFDKAEELIRSSGDPHEIADVLNASGFARYLAGDTEIAVQKLQEGLPLVREVGDLLLTAGVEGSLADAELAAGNRDAAEAGWRRELELAGEVGSLVGAVEALTGLGRLALAEGHLQRSFTLLAAAAEVLRQTGSRWLEPHVSGAVGDARARADGVLNAVEAEAAWQRGTRMTLAEAVIYGLSSDAGRDSAAVPDDAAASSRAVVAAGFTHEGEYWSIAFAGRVVRLRDSKGLQDIARLVAAPGTQIAAVDLAFMGATPGQAKDSGVSERTGFGVESDAGAALDVEARRQYRERLADLEDEVVAAENANDPVRADRARQEREFIVDELKAAVGWGGRDRRMLDPAERARKAVTGRIRDAIARIEAVHADFGEHLRRNVRTGAFCVYDPPVSVTQSQ